MTREPTQNGGGGVSTAGAKRLTPTSVQINMPEQDRGTDTKQAANPQNHALGTIEEMLGRLLGRLDDNDRRYGAALDELNHRLNDLSERTQRADTTQNPATGDTLERLRNQASMLAAQVNEAGSAHQSHARESVESQPHRVVGYANDDRPAPDLGNNHLNTSFADVTQRLEKSLTSGTPSGELDSITRKLDDLGGRLDVALSRQNDTAALQAIEVQLGALGTGFGEVRQNYARVAAIEENLSQLMNWARTGGGQPNENDTARLDAIEQTLSALDRNARDMDARTVSTLEAMNEALHSIASHGTKPQEPGKPQAKSALSDRSDPAPNADSLSTKRRPQEDETATEVWIEERPDSEFDAYDTTEDTARIEAELGANISDYQPAPGRIVDHPGTRERVEPTFEDGNEFIESARRAAAAAAQEPAQKSSGTGLGKRLVASMNRSRADQAGKPRRILYILAAGLMLTSAGLMYARLHTQPKASGPAVLNQKTVPPDSVTPGSPAQKPEQKNRSSLDTPPEPVDQPAGKTAVRMSDVAPAQGTPSVMQTGGDAVTPAPRPAVMQPKGPISTATVLASLTPATVSEQMPGVSFNVTEPVRTPARRTHATRSVAPLVPETGSIQTPSPLALPRRVPSPSVSPQRRTTAIDTGKVDSARANKVTPLPTGDLPSSSMPPARIGPNSLRVAAARGNPAAQVEIASRFAKGSGVPRDMKKASEWYGRAAAQGFAPAQYRLAALFERGQGVKKDINVARTWYRRAAELGNVRAMHNLAVLYTRDEGTGVDYTSAKNWFYQAARYGLADSQYNLGILYDSGLGVKKNAAEAFKWFSLAARQGDTEAGRRREALRLGLPSRSLIAAEQTVRKWRALKPSDEANNTAPPRGGWQNAPARTSQGAYDPARVKRAQALLNKLGYDAGAPDGKLGPQTIAAIQKFQTRAGVPGSPRVTADLLQRLEALAG